MTQFKYYRNKKFIRGIDLDALWRKMGPFLVLLDDDQDVRVDFEYYEKDFYPVEPPAELHNEKAPD